MLLTKISATIGLTLSLLFLGGEEGGVRTMFASAIRSRDLDCVKTILESNPELAVEAIGAQAEPTLRNESDGTWPAFGKTYTALHILALNPTTDSPSHEAKENAIVAELLRHGAKLNTRCAGGQMPVDIALQNGRDGIAKMLTLLAYSQGIDCPKADRCLSGTPKTLELVIV